MAEVGAGFGKTVPAPVLTCVLQSELPVRISTAWRQSNPRPIPMRSQREADRPAGQRRPCNAARRAVPGAGTNRGAGAYDLVDDLTGHRAGRNRPCPVRPADQGAGKTDLVRQIVKKARTEGITATRQAVRGRLAQDVPLGYSGAGIAIEVGDAVSGIRPGQLVATGGAGKANHAEFQAVPGLLCAAAPEKVSAQDAAFTTIAAIALHGLRIADVGPGSKVVVIGLGLIGQLAARLAMAAGCDVAGIDPARYPRVVATGTGVLALDELGVETTEQVMAWSRGRGADAVLVCAAGSSSAAVMRVPELCRDRAAVVIVGDVGLQLNRTPFYQRELDLRFARSYGPGRYEPSYEEWGIDYPAGQVRWTEGRNFEAILDLLAAGRLSVADLVTHAFDISRAVDAYKLIAERSEPFLAIRLDYPGAAADPGGPVRVREATVASPRLDRSGRARRRLGWRGRVLHRHAASRFAGSGFYEAGNGGFGWRAVGDSRGAAVRLRESGRGS